jgi:hypothetical protein
VSLIAGYCIVEPFWQFFSFLAIFLICSKKPDWLQLYLVVSMAYPTKNIEIMDGDKEISY